MKPLKGWLTFQTNACSRHFYARVWKDFTHALVTKHHCDVRLCGHFTKSRWRFKPTPTNLLQSAKLPSLKAMRWLALLYLGCLCCEICFQHLGKRLFAYVLQLMHFFVQKKKDDEKQNEEQLNECEFFLTTIFAQLIVWRHNGRILRHSLRFIGWRHRRTDINRSAWRGNPAMANVSCAFTWNCFKQPLLMQMFLCFFGLSNAAGWIFPLAGRKRFINWLFSTAAFLVKFWAWLYRHATEKERGSQPLFGWGFYKIAGFYILAATIRCGDGSQTVASSVQV